MKGTLKARQLKRLKRFAAAVFEFHQGNLVGAPLVHEKGVNAPLGVIYFVETGTTALPRIIAELGVRKVRPYCYRFHPRMPEGQPGTITLGQVQAVYPHLAKLLKNLSQMRGYEIWETRRRVAPRRRRSWMCFPMGLTLKIHEKDEYFLRLFEELEILPLNPVFSSKLGRISRFINEGWHLRRDRGEPESFHAVLRWLREKPKAELNILLRPHILGTLARFLKDGGAFTAFLRKNGLITTYTESRADLIANGNQLALKLTVLPDKALRWRVRRGEGLPVLFRYQLGPWYSVRVALLPWETESWVNVNDRLEVPSVDPFGFNEFLKNLTPVELANLGGGD